MFFTPLDVKTADAFKLKFSGSQKAREEKADGKKDKKAKKAKEEIKLAEDQVAHFNKYISLKVAKIVKVEPNPEGDKLYIETLDDGSGKERIIQSGLRQYLKPEELLGKNIILASNLAPRKMKGVESYGMLLAADYKKEDGSDGVEPLEAPWAAPGDKVYLEGFEDNEANSEDIGADVFFQVAINIKDKTAVIDGKTLCVKGQAIKTVHTVNGEVH